MNITEKYRKSEVISTTFEILDTQELIKGLKGKN